MNYTPIAHAVKLLCYRIAIGQIKTDEASKS
jgi:hypothetical protein